MFVRALKSSGAHLCLCKFVFVLVQKLSFITELLYLYLCKFVFVFVFLEEFSIVVVVPGGAWCFANLSLSL